MIELFSFILVAIAGFASMIFAVASGGGAIVILPTIIFVGVGPASAVATTRVGITAATIASFPLLRGKLNIGKKIPFLLIVFHSIGAIIGAIILTQVIEGLLFGFVGFIMVFGGIITFISKKGSVTMQKKLIKKKSVALATVLLFVIGIYRGFFGPASGTLNRLVFINVLKLSQIQSLAIANYSAFFASFFSAIIFFFAGLINFEFGFFLAIGTVIGAVVGVKTALLKGNLWLSKVFGILAIIIGLSLIFLR